MEVIFMKSLGWRDGIKHLFVLVILLFTSNMQAQLPDDFVDDLLYSNLNEPVGITFDKNGIGYVWERKGKVFLLNTDDILSPQPIIDISDEVGGWWDHGMLGFTLDPLFMMNGYVYLFYTVDRHHMLNFGSTNYDPTVDEYDDASISRVVRYTLDSSTNFETVLPDSRKILLGIGPGDGFPVLMPGHGVGSLVFGTDRSLLVSYGDQGSFTGIDVGDYNDTYHVKAMAEGIIREAENVGAYKSQMLNSYAGKILRLDPETGDGLASNPYYDNSNPRSPQSRVWVRGLRNPFRMILRPETGSHLRTDADPGVIYTSVVGAGRWEELNIAHTHSLNFGWPVWEGYEKYDSYEERKRPNKDTPNPLFGSSGCDEEFYNFHELLFVKNNQTTPLFIHPCSNGEVINPNAFPSFHEQPAVAWRNASKTDTTTKVNGYAEDGRATGFEIGSEDTDVQGHHFNGNSGIMGGFYEWDNFPESYKGKLFCGDFSGWIKAFEFNDNNQLVSVDSFHNSTKNITSINFNPINGKMYYIRFEQNQLRRISYGGNAKPIAEASADIYYGPSPLTVNFDASQSFDPENEGLTYAWDFGDGTSSEDMNPVHVFESLSNEAFGFEVQLTVTDEQGATAVKPIQISLNNTPPNVQILDIEDGSRFPNDEKSLYILKALIADEEHSNQEMTYAWQTTLMHNDHSHPNTIDPNEESVVLLDATGCEETYWYRIELTVTDQGGLSGKDIREVFPWCDGEILEEITTLTGEAEQDGVTLNWTLNAPASIARFEVQRLNDLKTIGTVDYDGSLAYTFKDLNPINGTNTYRLKAIMANDLYRHSNQVKVNFPPDPTIHLYPNPANQVLNIKFKDFGTETLVRFLMYDSAGALMLVKEEMIPAGEADGLQLITSELPNGVYFYKAYIGASDNFLSGKVSVVKR